MRQTYAELREKHGFRILTYNVDSDAASPRVCFQFSESLARKADRNGLQAILDRDFNTPSLEDRAAEAEVLEVGGAVMIAGLQDRLVDMNLAPDRALRIAR